MAPIFARAMTSAVGAAVDAGGCAACVSALGEACVKGCTLVAELAAADAAAAVIWPGGPIDPVQN